jgi:hypothetical protein
MFAEDDFEALFGIAGGKYRESFARERGGEKFEAARIVVDNHKRYVRWRRCR